MSPRPAPTPPPTAGTPRQEEVLDHALALVQEVGLSGLTVRELARRVGFSEAALYKHYPSKESLLLALMERLRGRLMGPIRRAAQDPDRSPAERLAAMLRHHVSLILEVGGLPILVLAEAAVSGNKALVEGMRAQVGEYLGLLESVADELPPAPGRPAARELVLLLVGLPAATAIFHRLHPDAALEARARGELADYLVERLAGP
jgi:AcrR family transcriptional regulator